MRRMFKMTENNKNKTDNDSAGDLEEKMIVRKRETFLRLRFSLLNLKLVDA